MIEITFAGEVADRNKVRLIAEESETLRSVEEDQGIDGAELIRITLDYGPDTLKLLTALTAFVAEGIRLGRSFKVTVDSTRTDKEKSP